MRYSYEEAKKIKIKYLRLNKILESATDEEKEDVNFQVEYFTAVDEYVHAKMSYPDLEFLELDEEEIYAEDSDDARVVEKITDEEVEKLLEKLLSDL